MNMPELPEAETIARRLHEELAGETLGRATVKRRDILYGDPRPLGRVVSNRRVRRVYRRAKRVIIELASGGSDAEHVDLVFHLGMSGQLLLCDQDAPREAHTHLRIAIMRTTRELRFRDPRRFGGVWILAGGKKHVGRRLGELGPEPLELSAKEFRSVLSRRRQIKALLLDQRCIAGLGNIYCDEALHAAGVHPLTRADDLGVDRSARLLRSIKTTLRSAIRFNGSTLMDYRTADGEAGEFQKHHRVYQRTGQPCKNCRTPIERIIAAGRSTFFCPRCQQP